MTPETQRQQPLQRQPVVSDPLPADVPDRERADGDVFSLTDSSGRPSRRRLLIAGGVAAMLLVGGGAVAAASRGGSSDGGDDPTASATDLATATVEKRTLEERTELDGTLGYGSATDVSLAADGTITALPAIGTIIDRGQSLLEVNSLPVPLLFGDRPLWRQLEAGIDDGPDIQQLEANLVALGIVSADDLTVDNTWTSATTSAVKKWQKSLGQEQTGVVGTGAVVVLPGAVRVASHPAPVGSPAGGGAVLGVTGSTHLITIELEATRQRLVQQGQPVRIVLPDGTETTGTVAAVGTVATAGETDSQGNPGDPTIEVTVAFDDPAASGTLDQAPVKVLVVTSAASDVLAVPVQALLAVSGGYAVEVRQASGTTSRVPVELGAFADGWVQVTGDIAEGDEVVVPSD